MGIVIEHLEWIRRAVGTAVMPVHHSGKDGKTYQCERPTVRPMRLSRIAKDDDVITVTCDKAKNTEEFKPRPVPPGASPNRPHYATAKRDELCILPQRPGRRLQDTTAGDTTPTPGNARPGNVRLCGAKASTVGSMLRTEANLYKSLAVPAETWLYSPGIEDDPYYITDWDLSPWLVLPADKKDSTLLYSPPKVE